MPKCQHLAQRYTTTFLRRQCRRHVMTSATTTWRRHVGDTSSTSSCQKDNTSRKDYWQNDVPYRRNRVKIHWFQYKTRDKNATWRRRTVDKKDVFPIRNHVVHCTKTRKLNAEMATCRTNVLCTTFLRRQRRPHVMTSSMPTWRRRQVDDETSSLHKNAKTER